jgi:biotin carboxyl carrier protein
MPSSILAHPSVSPKTKEIAMERKFKITVDGREYKVTVEELTEPGGVSHPELSVSMARPASPISSFTHANSAPVQAEAPITSPAEAGDVVSTLGGVVESLLVTTGQEVHAGDRVAIVEAMKMKTPITAHQPGKVAAILVNVGDGVQTGQALVKLT